MRFGLLHELVSFGLAALGLGALSLGSELGPGVLVALFVGFVASSFVGPRTWSRPGYDTLWNAFVVALLALQVARGMMGVAILSLGLEFAAALQIAKLFHRRTAKDYQHIQTLAFLHLVAATVLSSGLDYAFYFLGFVVVTPWMLALTHLRNEIESHYGPEGPESAPDVEEGSDPAAGNERVERVLRSRRIAGPGFLFATAGLSVPLFVITAAFFMLFPRVGLGFLNFGAADGRQVAGFGSDVSLGGFGVIRDDPTVVLRVTPSDLSEDPPERSFRLRGTSFDRYRDARWTRSPARAEEVFAAFSYYDLSGAPRTDADLTLDIVLDALDEPVLFFPSGTLGVSMAPRVAGGYDVQRRLMVSPGLDVRYAEPDGLEVHYTVHVDTGRRTLPTSLDEPTAARYLQLPDGLERLSSLARERAGVGSAAEQAARLESWLRDSGDFTYSLEMPDVEGRDPLEAFVFDARSGHCEYFSTALAVMLRTLGIPSRNVTGFIGGLYNPYGRYYAIRQGDAHSWVEAHYDGAWHVLDPTPPSRGDLGPSEDGWLVAVRGALDALRVKWARDVVGYDLRRQMEGLREMMRWFRSMRGGRESSAPARARGQRTGGLGGWMVPVALAVLALLGGAWAWRRRRRRDAPVRLDPGAREAKTLYEELERAMARSGIPRAAHRTPREHAKDVAATAFPAADAIVEVTDAYELARFGGVTLPPERVRALKHRIAEVRAAR